MIRQSLTLSPTTSNHNLKEHTEENGAHMRNGTTYYNRNNKEQELETEEKKRENNEQEATVKQDF